MARTPVVTRDMIPEELRAAFDQDTSSTGGVVTSGPGSVMINSPEMRRRANHLVDYLRRGESTLSDKTLQLAMLITARAMDCQFIWHAHAAHARQVGLSDALVDAIRDKRPLPAVSADESIVLNYGTEFFKNHKVSQETFDAALSHLGARGLTELTTLMGYYAMLAFNANAFEIDVPQDGPEPLLPV